MENGRVLYTSWKNTLQRKFSCCVWLLPLLELWDLFSHYSLGSTKILHLRNQRRPKVGEQGPPPSLCVDPARVNLGLLRDRQIQKPSRGASGNLMPPKGTQPNFGGLLSNTCLKTVIFGSFYDDFVNCAQIQRVRKKGATLFFVITLPNPNRSSKLF